MGRPTAEDYQRMSKHIMRGVVRADSSKPEKDAAAEQMRAEDSAGAMQEAANVPATNDKPTAAAVKPGVKYDFRKLAEPERTNERVRALLLDSRLSHGARCVGIALALEFSGGSNVQLVSVAKLLPDSCGYSEKLRNLALKALREAGLISMDIKRGRGCVVELLF